MHHLITPACGQDAAAAKALPTGSKERVQRQLSMVAAKIRSSHDANPDAYDEREPLWIEHFNLLVRLESMT